MTQHLGSDGIFGNPASRSHVFGQEASTSVEAARDQVAALIRAEPFEIIWTSGATESINLAIKGVAGSTANRGKHVVTSCLEHRATLDVCDQLTRKGYEITYLAPNREGLISPDAVEQALREDTVLVSLMHVNNEVGTITDIETVAELTRRRRIAFHVDAVQSAARLPLDMNYLHADLLSLSAHKMYGPKGVGALYVRSNPRIQIEPQMHGGGHEHGLRAGTLPTHQLVGMGEAARLVRKHLSNDVTAVRSLDSRLLRHLTSIGHAFFNGNQAHRVSGILNVAFACVESESLMMALKHVAISSGSACTSSRVEPSYVLKGLGLDEDLANCSVRFSFGRYTTQQEIDFTASCVQRTVDALRQLSPDWQSSLDHSYPSTTMVVT